MDPITQSFIDTLVRAGAPKSSELSYVDGRAALEGLQDHKSATDVEVEVVEVPFESGEFATHIY